MVGERVLLIELDAITGTKELEEVIHLPARGMIGDRHLVRFEEQVSGVDCICGGITSVR